MVTYAEKKFNRISQESSCSPRIPPVEWIMPSYDAIVFNDGEFFCQKIVPLFDIGRQATYSSFLRRLHRWGFRQFQYVETSPAASAGDCAPGMLPELLAGPESTNLADSIHSTGLVSATSSQSSARVAFRHSGFRNFVNICFLRYSAVWGIDFHLRYRPRHKTWEALHTRRPTRREQSIETSEKGDLGSSISRRLHLSMTMGILSACGLLQKPTAVWHGNG
jgi:HSF-type DNA-binding